MAPPLAYADAGDPSNSNLLIVLIAAGIVLGIGTATVFVVALARSRRRRGESLMVLAVLWGILAAASLIVPINTHLTWSREYNLRIQSGYFDPQDTADAPHWPWLWWSILAAIYLAGLAWAIRPAPRASKTG